MFSESNVSKQLSGIGEGDGVGSMIEEVGTSTDDDVGIDIVVVNGVSEVCLVEDVTIELLAVVVGTIDVEVVNTVLVG